MIDHLGIVTGQFEPMLAFYKAALAPLGYSQQAAYPGVAGLGGTGEPADLWLTAAEGAMPVHVALRSPDRATVDAFHAAALAAGGRDNGGPGLRPNYSPDYYAAFVLDPDGNNLELVCHAPA
jgi:catechol 2,3-dioxygenase-like lactoylglutathione lyase family enzyme